MNNLPPPVRKLLDTAEAKKKEGDLHFSRKNWQQAVESYHAAVMTLNPLRPLPMSELCTLRCLTNQIQCFIKLEEYEKAASLCRFALTVPCAASEIHLAQKIHTRCAIALENLGKYEAALHSIHRAISYDPADDALDSIKDRIVEAINNDSEHIVAIPPRPLDLTADMVSKTIVEIINSHGNVERIMPILDSMFRGSVFIDRRDEKGFNILWAVCQAAKIRAKTPEENPDDVFPLVEALIMHGARAEQRYKEGEKDVGHTPLMHMASAGAVDCARLLLKFGASVITCDAEGWTALMVACAPNSIRVADGEGGMRTNDEMVDMLIESKSVINNQNVHGLHALSYACQSGDISSAALLIEAGAKLNLRSANGFSPIVWALIGAKGDENSEMVQTLLDACVPSEEVEQNEEGDDDEEREQRKEEDEKAKADKREELKGVLEEYLEDMKCFKLSHLVMELKRELNQYLQSYKKTAAEKVGKADAKPATYLVQRRLADSIGRFTRAVEDAGGSKEMCGKYLATAKGNIYTAIFDKLQDTFLSDALFRRWTPADNPEAAHANGSKLDQARLSIMMTAAGARAKGEAIFSRSSADDFLLCGRWNDYCMLVREPLVSVFSACIPSQPVLDAIVSTGPLVFMVSTGGDYWVKMLREHATDRQLDMLLVKSSFDLPPFYFNVEGAIANVEDLKDFQERTLVLLWPISNVLATSSKEGVEADEALLRSYSGDKIIIIGNLDLCPPGKPTDTIDYLKSHFECTQAIEMKNWPNYKNSLTVWKKS